MSLRPVKVISYAGYRGDEAPRRFLEGNDMIEVVSVETAWVEEALRSRDRRRCFTVRDRRGMVHRLCCVESSGLWYAERHNPRATF